MPDNTPTPKRANLPQSMAHAVARITALEAELARLTEENARLRAVVEERSVAKRSTAASQVSRVCCRDCDGCGWVEGGATLQTRCRACGGTGLVSSTPEEA